MRNHPSIKLLICVLMSLITLGSARAGEFGATFNMRLNDQRSSWEVAEVISVHGKCLKAKPVCDLYRHSPRWAFKIRNRDGIRPGDHILINYWKKPNRHSPRWAFKIRNREGIKPGDRNLINYWKKPIIKLHEWHPSCAAYGPNLMGKIDETHKRVDSLGGICYESAFLTWFYRTGRWNARVKWISGSDTYCWYAVLSSGKRYRIYDEANPKHQPQYPYAKE